MELFEKRRRAEQARVIQRSSRCDSWISTGPGVDPAGLYGQSTPAAGAAAAAARGSAQDYQAFMYGSQAPCGGVISHINSVDSSVGETFLGTSMGLDAAKNNQTYRTVTAGLPAEPIYNHLHSLRNNHDYQSFVVNPAGASSGRGTPNGFRTPTPELAHVVAGSGELKYLPLATVQKAPRTVYVTARDMHAARATHLQYDADAESPTILPPVHHGRHTPV